MSTTPPPNNNGGLLTISDTFLLESIIDFAIIGINKDGLIIRWNAGAESILGWSAAEMLGQPVARFFTLEDNAISRPETEMEQALLFGRSADERWHLRKDGTRFWATGEMMPLKNGGDQIVGYVKVFSDRTSQRLAATEMLQQNQILGEQILLNFAAKDLIWKNSPDLLLIVGNDGILRDVNPAWTSILGWSISDLVGKHFHTLVHPDDLPATYQAFNGAAGQKLPNFENRHLHKDGSFRWILWTSTPQANYIYAIGKDVTKEKLQAEALRKSEDALRQAQKMEAIGQLTGGLAHDFNNMLAGIMGNLELLQVRVTRGSFQNAQRYIDAAMSVTNRAAALTHRLLAFSRRQTLDPKPTEVNRLVEGMKDLLERTLGPSIILETARNAEASTVVCDPNQLENVLLNLAINSRDAMPQGGRLIIGVYNTKIDQTSHNNHQNIAQGEYVKITVSDTGVGMTPDILQRALDPFFTTKPMGQGTGLGLSMVYGFVTQSKGYLLIDSYPDGGTSVHIFLPSVNQTSEHVEKLSKELEFPKIARKMSILLVEDEESVRKVAYEVLTDMGYTVVEASDASQALQRFEAMDSLDLLVTDVGLPNGMNGRQLADAIRGKKPEIDVLFITGFADVAATGNGLDESGMQTLTKPFSMTTLATKVQSIIDGS
nr:PAS domain S-box protein [uncultured Noviherbaspirillum sp.]